MSDIILWQPGFTYNAYVPFTKNKERIKEIKEIGDSRYIHLIYIIRFELDKACSEHDMTYGDFKDLNSRTVADKILCDKAFKIAKDPKYDGHQRRLCFNDLYIFGKKNFW